MKLQTIKKELFQRHDDLGRRAGLECFAVDG
jgi:hypothetical protein